MSKLKLPHASGNSMSIAAPATNPASDLELKLPATIGAAGQVLQNSSTPGTLEFGTVGKFVSCALLIDQKSQDTAGGTFTSGAHRVRDLNTEVFDPDNIVTLSSNEFTLASAGSYVIQWFAPCYKVDNNVSRLREVTDGTIREGTNSFAHSATQIQVHSEGMARVTQTGSKTYRIEHKSTATKADNGFGVASAAVAGYDTFTMVTIWKEA